jgi:hypothetical protein
VSPSISHVEQALLRLLDAWARSRNRVLAEAIDRLTTHALDFRRSQGIFHPPMLGERPKPSDDDEWANWLARMSPIDLPRHYATFHHNSAGPKARLAALAAFRPDPRAARILVEWLQMSWSDDFWHRMDCNREMIAALEQHLDPRLLRGLESVAQVGKACGARRAEFASLLTSLRGTELELDADDLGLLAEVDALPRSEGANYSRSSPNERANELFRAVYADPEDKALKRELANCLLTAGDPRGEFILLQLDAPPTRKGSTRRELALIKQYGRQWLGGLNRLVDDHVVYEEGFATKVNTGHPGPPFGRGSERPLTDPFGVASHPEWAMVRSISVWAHAGAGTGELFRTAALPALRELLNLGWPDLEQLLDGPKRAITRLHLYSRRTGLFGELYGDEYCARLLKLADVCPKLTDVCLSAVNLEASFLEGWLSQFPSLDKVSFGGSRALFSQMVGVARARGLSEIGLLGNVDLTLELASGRAGFSFTGWLGDPVEREAESAVAYAAQLGATSLVVRVPVGASARGQFKRTKLPAFVLRKKQKMDLDLIWNAAAKHGLSCEWEPEPVPKWLNPASMMSDK